MAIGHGFTLYGFAPPTAPLAPSALNYARDYCAQIAHFLRGNPSMWTQGTLARDGDGNGVEPLGPHARSWCAMGLVQRFVPQKEIARACEVLLSRAVMPLVGHGFAVSPVSFNDSSTCTVADVIRMFEAASRLPDAVEPVTKRTTNPAVSKPNEDISEESISEVVQELKKLYGSGDNDINPIKPPNYEQLVPWATIMKQIKESVTTCATT